MTIDRAIQILDPDHREHYDGLAEVNEACRMGMAALQERQERENPEPLTLEELRGMDGEPVRISDEGATLYGLVSLSGSFLTDAEVITLSDGDFYSFDEAAGLKIYPLAYRSKPEQEE